MNVANQAAWMNGMSGAGSRTVNTKKFLQDVLEEGCICNFRAALADAELTLSVLHELCRYRSGCVAVAEYEGRGNTYKMGALDLIVRYNWTMLHLMRAQIVGAFLPVDENPYELGITVVDELRLKMGMIEQVSAAAAMHVPVRCWADSCLLACLLRPPSTYLDAV